MFLVAVAVKQSNFDNSHRSLHSFLYSVYKIVLTLSIFEIIQDQPFSITLKKLVLDKLYDYKL